MNMKTESRCFINRDIPNDQVEPKGLCKISIPYCHGYFFAHRPQSRLLKPGSEVIAVNDFFAQPSQFVLGIKSMAHDLKIKLPKFLLTNSPQTNGRFNRHKARCQKWSQKDKKNRYLSAPIFLPLSSFTL